MVLDLFSPTRESLNFPPPGFQSRFFKQLNSLSWHQCYKPITGSGIELRLLDLRFCPYYLTKELALNEYGLAGKVKDLGLESQQHICWRQSGHRIGVPATLTDASRWSLAS